jgi:hypothetical protein
VLAARLAREFSPSLASIPPLCGLQTRTANVNSDFKPDVRSLSFSLDLTRNGTVVPEAKVGRQDFSLQNARTCP